VNILRGKFVHFKKTQSPKEKGKRKKNTCPAVSENRRAFFFWTFVFYLLSLGL